MKNKKKIGIITFQHANNYGAVFQAYALSKYLENHGHDVFILDYHKDKENILNYLKHPIAFLRKILNTNALTLKFFSKTLQTRKEVQHEKPFDAVFNDFRKQYLKITKSSFNYKKLVNNCPKADAFICGSDQVWSADFVFSSPAYLLGFVPDNTIKISYAPSFGKNRLEPHLHKTFKRYLTKFNAISVREQNGVDIIKDVTELDATHVLDPTLLLDNYAEIIDYSLVPDKPYIFVYRLGQEYKLAHWMLEIIKDISKKMKITVLSVSTNCPWSFNEIGKKLQPTPGQLLGLIERSTFFLTNSFHGTVFAILFRRKFLTFARDVYKDKQNVRMTDLLTSLKLDGLYCPQYTDIETVESKLNQGCNYESVYKKLEMLRCISMNFLRDALQ